MTATARAGKAGKWFVKWRGQPLRQPSSVERPLQRVSPSDPLTL